MLAGRPDGPPRLEDFALEEGPIPEPGAGEVLMRTLWLSLDPYLRGRMGSSASHSSSTAPVPLGGVMEGGTVSQVVSSNDGGLASGDLVVSAAGWQEYAVAPAASLRRIDARGLPASTALGVLGMPGLTAYAGLHVIGRPAAGETVVVAAATGTVGSLVGQLARIAGARAVGIAGGQRKSAWLRECAIFDAVVDHRSPDFVERLADATPDGIDVYFENVGGHVWQAVWPRLNRHARVPVCGIASAYNASVADVSGDVAGLMSGLVTRSITLQGFVFRDHEQLRPQFEADVGRWVNEGRIAYHEDVVEGLANAPAAFLGMLAGEHVGKRLVRVAHEATARPRRASRGSRSQPPSGHHSGSSRGRPA
ncbi:NADP-dependent oxidoreductase [Nocardioides panacihumi]|uniref:NADP-dependent oxidoreductase n=1 Tax=Nocardioides panacihumi TaxID=400774 RepID=A0ABN2QAP8_9ACTN